MYHTDPHPDPYANQYPPPPPLATEYRNTNEGYTSPAPVSNAYVAPIQQTYSPSSHQQGYLSQGPQSSPALSLNDRQEIAAAGHRDRYEDPSSFQSVPMNEPKAHSGHSMDPQAMKMDDYRQTERHEQLYNDAHQQYGGGYYVDYHEEPDLTNSHTPMVHGNNYNKKYPTGPMMAPENEADAYRPKVYQREEHRRSGCNCCCYNPAMTCCSCFCFLISLGFLAAGIALIIASKVITDKCNTQCGEAAEKAASYGVDDNPCDSICGKVVHDGLLYGGIGVTALSGIAVIWRLFMWMCAAGSRR